MSYNTDLQSKNARIEALITRANALPEAYDDLPTLTNAGTADDLLEGKQLLDGNGNVVTGTRTLFTTTVIDDVSQKIIDGTIEEIKDDRVERIRSSIFAQCIDLHAVVFSACSYIGKDAFRQSRLITAAFPVCINTGLSTFYNCSMLRAISFPSCERIDAGAFAGCDELTAISFPTCTTISGIAFKDCSRLSYIVLGASTVCTLSNSNAFTSTPYAGNSSYFSGTPHIYVPASLINTYKSATNWVYFSSYFSAIENIANRIIMFTIDGIPFYSEEGMTWEDFIDSEYNCYGEFIYGGDDYNTIYFVSDVIFQALIDVSPYDVIIEGKNYTLDK